MRRIRSIFLAFAVALPVTSSAQVQPVRPQLPRQFFQPQQNAELEQVPSWSVEDMAFFLRGSLSTEFVPETVLRAFIATYPDLFPTPNFQHLGMIYDGGEWPIGLSRRAVPHLGGLSAIGTNCAACHVAQLEAEGKAVRVLGVTSQFDAEAFFGTILVATFRTGDPANMKRFLAAYLTASDPGAGPKEQALLKDACDQQSQKIAEAMATDPSGAKGLAPGGLHPLDGAALRLDLSRLADGLDLAALAHELLKLFHNMRAAVHYPDEAPAKAPPASGPGRNDAFGLLSAALFGAPQPFAPVKYGVVWNLEQRHWVHWDGNAESPLGRNILASLGLGAPLVGKRGYFEFADVQRQTQISERIRSPRYPFGINLAAASRGAAHYEAHCASCHNGPETDARLFPPAEIGTDPARAAAFTPKQADLFNQFLASIESPGYTPQKKPAIRGTTKYWSPTLAGVWARSPYLHNGSVRTMQELLTPPAGRAKSFYRGSREYDVQQMGHVDAGPYLLETAAPGNSNAGHDYGTRLLPEERRDLIEFLKTL